jgi:hypothetical protein
MPRWVKIILWIFLSLVLLLGTALGFFMYKVKFGIPSYETEAPTIDIPDDRPAILLYSKTTGFRHSEAIDASKPMFEKMAEDQQWFLYETEESGIINAEQLSQFEVIIWNNSTGKGLTDEQRSTVQNYIENGGGLIGIHGAGDDSHNWDWYKNNLLGARFSHHPVKNQLQETTVYSNNTTDSLLQQKLPSQWQHTDEWYVFFSHPKEKGFSVLCHIDGEEIDPNGNLLWISDKDFGMGKAHPIAWYKTIQQGRTFYTSMGHTGATFNDQNFIQLIENAIRWAGELN